MCGSSVCLTTKLERKDQQRSHSKVKNYRGYIERVRPQLDPIGQKVEVGMSPYYLFLVLLITVIHTLIIVASALISNNISQTQKEQ